MGPGAILQLAGGGLQAYGTYMQGREQNIAARYNARLLKQRAIATEQAMESETELMTERARELKATQRAVAAKSGAQITSGTPLLVLAEQAGKMQRDILEHRRSRMIQAQQFRSQAKQVRYAGRMARRTGTIGAIGTLLGTGAGMAL